MEKRCHYAAQPSPHLRTQAQIEIDRVGGGVAEVWKGKAVMTKHKKWTSRVDTSCVFQNQVKRAPLAASRTQCLHSVSQLI